MWCLDKLLWWTNYVLFVWKLGKPDHDDRVVKKRIAMTVHKEGFLTFKITLGVLM
jgi:hypothetical protein